MAKENEICAYGEASGIFMDVSTLMRLLVDSLTRSSDSLIFEKEVEGVVK